MGHPHCNTGKDIPSIETEKEVLGPPRRRAHIVNWTLGYKKWEQQETLTPAAAYISLPEGDEIGIDEGWAGEGTQQP